MLCESTLQALCCLHRVLILVLLEYALRVVVAFAKVQYENVLILVLLEYALRVIAECGGEFFAAES